MDILITFISVGIGVATCGLQKSLMCAVFISSWPLCTVLSPMDALKLSTPCQSEY
jgi:hypothetical protein